MIRALKVAATLGVEVEAVVTVPAYFPTTISALPNRQYRPQRADRRVADL